MRLSDLGDACRKLNVSNTTFPELLDRFFHTTVLHQVKHSLVVQGNQLLSVVNSSQTFYRQKKSFIHASERNIEIHSVGNLLYRLNTVCLASAHLWYHKMLQHFDSKLGSSHKIKSLPFHFVPCRWTNIYLKDLQAKVEVLESKTSWVERFCNRWWKKGKKIPYF